MIMSMSQRCALLTFLLAVGCGSGSQSVSETTVSDSDAESNTEESGDDQTACSRYRVGDYVVYEQTINHPDEGSWTATLVEVVEEQDCARLVLHDWMDIRGERREWRIHLTDTPENQQANRPDAVYIRRGEEWVEAGWDELVETFSVGIDVDGPTEEVSVEQGTCDVTGEQLPCSIRTTVGTVLGNPARVVCSRSEAFLWTNIGCEYLATDGSETTYMRMVPLRHGRMAEDQVLTAFELLEAGE